ncbi:MAG: cupin domain-containing protein [Aquihabitans sp.]
MIENPQTGEQVEVLGESEACLRMRVTWPRPGHRAIEHLHPGMEERFEVVEGRFAVRVDGAGGTVVEGGPGTTVAVPAGTVHLAWNPTDEPVVLIIEMRPALRWREFVERLFAGEDAIGLLDEFSAEVALPSGTVIDR